MKYFAKELTESIDFGGEILWVFLTRVLLPLILFIPYWLIFVPIRAYVRFCRKLINM